MSQKLKALRDQRDQLAKNANEVNNKYGPDVRMSKEDAVILDGLLNDINNIDADIAREKQIADLSLDQFDQGDFTNQTRDQYTQDPTKHNKESSIIRAYLTGGMGALNQQQKEVMQARTPGDLRNAMSTTTDAEGGYTTAEEWVRSLESAMKAYGGMYSAAEIMRTATGNTINFPTADATAEEGEIVGQNAAVTTQDTTFGNKSMGAFMYSSKAIALPWELLQDSFFNLDAYIQDLLAMRIGRITNRHFTVGTGSNQPMGIVTASQLGVTGKAGGGLDTGVNYDSLVALEHSVDPAYRNQPGVGYMFHDSTLEHIRTIKDKNERPIFVPGYEQGNPGGAPDRLLNRPITINQHMPVMAASAKSILFGQLSKYKIRQVQDLRLFRMTDSKYTEKAQTGFIGYQRLDGNLIDAGGAVKHYKNAAN